MRRNAQYVLRFWFRSQFLFLARLSAAPRHRPPLSVIDSLNRIQILSVRLRLRRPWPQRGSVDFIEEALDLDQDSLIDPEDDLAATHIAEKKVCAHRS